MSTAIFNIIEFRRTVFLIAALPTVAFALGTGPQSFTLDGVLYATGTTTPLLDSNVQIKSQILDPSKTCVLYEEVQTVSTSSTSGYFNIQVGSVTGSAQRTSGAGADPGNAMGLIFSNVVTSAIPAAANGQCAAGYSPTSGALRYLRLIITPSSTGTPDSLSPDMTIGSVPTALVAESVTGINYVGGNIGIGTTNPGQTLDIVGNTRLSGNLLLSGSQEQLTATGGNLVVQPIGINIPSYLALVPSGTSPVSLLAVAGNSLYGGSTSWGFISQNGVDTFVGDYSPTGSLNLQTNQSTKMTILTNGSVGVGTTTPQTTLQVAGVISPASDNTYSLGNASYRFTTIYATNSTINTSDAREKKDIETSDFGLAFISKLRPVSFHWKDGPDTDLHYGLIAQETERVIAQLKGVEPSNVIVAHDKQTDHYGIKYTELISPLIKAVQEIYSKYVELESHHSSDARSIASLKENDEAKTKAIQELRREMTKKTKELEAITLRLEKIEKALANKSRD